MPNIYLCNTCTFTRVRDTDDKKRQKHGHFKTRRHPPGVAGVTRVPNVYLCNTCKFTRVRDTDDKKRQKHGHFKTRRHPPGVAGVTRVPNVYLCNTCKFTRVRDTDDKKRQKHGHFKTQRSPTGPTPRVAGVSSWHQEQKQKRDHYKTPAIIVVTLYLLLVCVGVVMYSGEYDVCECASTVVRQTFCPVWMHTQSNITNITVLTALNLSSSRNCRANDMAAHVSKRFGLEHMSWI